MNLLQNNTNPDTRHENIHSLNDSIESGGRTASSVQIAFVPEDLVPGNSSLIPLYVSEAIISAQLFSFDVNLVTFLLTSI